MDEILQLMDCLSRFRQMLINERQRVEAALAATHEPTLAVEDRANDDGVGFSEDDRALSLRLQLQTSLREVEHALQKFEFGSYGKCDRCGEDILKTDWRYGLRRVSASPAAAAKSVPGLMASGGDRTTLRARHTECD